MADAPARWQGAVPVAPPALPAGGETYRLAAPPAALPDIAARLGLPAVHRLEAVLTLTPRTAALIDLSGSLSAQVEQTCVVTLEPFEAAVEEAFTVVFTLDAGAAAAGGLPDDPLDDDAWPEPVEDGRIDLAELVIQQLALALDPYPRAPGAALPAAAGGATEEPPDRRRPFEGLAGLLKRDK